MFIYLITDNERNGAFERNASLFCHSSILFAGVTRTQPRFPFSNINDEFYREFEILLNATQRGRNDRRSGNTG